jgi:hypothetical protein
LVVGMMTQTEIERRKDRIRRDPSTARLCAKLGVTVERFLQDIERSPQAKLHDNQPPGREKERVAAVGAFFRGAFERFRLARDKAAHRFDDVAAPTALAEEDHARRLLGAQE